MKLLIDATNLSAGGGITHLRSVLKFTAVGLQYFNEIIVFGSESTLALLPDEGCKKLSHPWLNKNLFWRINWYVWKMPASLNKFGKGVLFNPGGGYSGSYRPFVTMCRNMLVFDQSEQSRFGFSLIRLRYQLLLFMQRRSFVRANGIIYISDYAKDTVEPMLDVQRRKRKVVKIPHGVAKTFRAAPKAQRTITEYNLQSPFRFLYVSTINYYKHQDVLIKVFTRLHQEGYPVQLTLIGGTTSSVIADEMLKELPKAGLAVQYLGVQKYSSLPEFYQSHDAVVYSSTCENMPNILVEAMASGLPICCSNASPMPEFLEDGGDYFDPTDEESVYRTIVKFLRDAAHRESLAKRSQELSQQYNWEKCAKQTYAFLAEFRES